jgi:hypothetical protein
MLVGPRQACLAPIALGAIAAALATNAPCAAQANDSCGAPTPIAGFGTFLTSTVGATTDGQPTSACLFFGSDQIWADVWMCWAAEASGLVKIETCGTGFDTKLAVYPGCACPDASSIIACNDDACSLQSRVTFAAIAGQSYMVRVGSYSSNGANPPTGAVTLTVASGALAEIVNPANGHVYVAFATTGWNAAEATAQALGSHLVTINDADENEWIRLNFGNLLGTDRRIWIGLNDAAVEGAFVWADGTPVSYTNWNPGEPNNSGGVEDWVEFLGSNGRWNDISESGGSFAHIGLVELGPPPPPACAADLNHDGIVGGADLGALLSVWGTVGNVPEDLNGDGVVGGADLGALLSAWGACQ